ncbi:MAG: transposase [Oceanospirillaceae bacterium]|nr:transposase [Oceanospirillaceae bacterium]MBT12917.1 transposase [Oceanospirillaceae bacterium]|tara:strand:- start:160669 stop:161382 length:714 start_codon:yes stop_codon:yes gene_type:complete
MARPPRINIANIPQHIVQIGHNNLNCFFDDEDYEFYLASLHKAAEQYDVDIHAYVLLPNAIQMVATPNIAQGISSMMQSLGRRYVQYINHRYQRSGTLWAGRYKSSVIDSEAYLLTCYRYVELKPMHEGLVEGPELYPWSSFRHHTGREDNPLISDHKLYLELADTREDRADEYSKLFRFRFDRMLLSYIAETIKLGQVLGGDQFTDKIEQIANHRVRPLKRGRPKKKKKSSEPAQQ